jgi:hypothetical protein
VNDLERSLVALGREVAVPETPDLVPAVRAQIAVAPRRRSTRALPRRRLVLALAVLVLAALGATLAIPDARSAFLRIFDIGGERIEIVEDLPEVPLATDLEILLGERVSLEEAKRRSDFELRELEGAPDRVYIGPRGTVWFLYGTPQRPRLLVSQTPRLGLDAPAVQKKLASIDTEVELVDVGGAPGAFLSGGPHFFFLLDEKGNTIEDSARLAENVLVWSEGGVAYRLEGDFDRDDALRLARTLRSRG